MTTNQNFELSMSLDTDQFQKTLSTACSKNNQLNKIDEGYIDLSIAAKGITVIYRNSRYKKKVRLLVNAALVVEDVTNTDKLLRKLEKRIADYFDHTYSLDDFTLSGANFVLDINVCSRASVADYLKVIQRIGRVKGFSPISYDCFNEKASFCLSGNSNDTDFLLYNLEKTVVDKLQGADAGQKQLRSASEQTRGILRAEVRLTKSKAIRAYTKAPDVPGQIMELLEGSTTIFMETFTRVIPFGNFYKMGTAVDTVRREVKDSTMRRKMLRLLALIPEKKSLRLAHKAMNCRDVDKVMEAFSKINLSPITISKRHDVKHLKSIYSYL